MEKLLKSTYLSNISIQLVGTVIAQTIPILVSPVLTRIYDERGFANYTLFFSIIAVLAVPLGGRYHIAIVVSDSDNEANKLSDISVILITVYTIVLLFLIDPFYEILNSYYELGLLWYFITFYLLVFGLYNVLLFKSIRMAKFKKNAYAKISQTIFTSINSILLGLLSFLSSGLILGKIIGVFISCFFLREKLYYNSKLINLKPIIKKYIEYPKNTIIPSLLNIFSLQALVFFVSLNYNENNLAYLGLANVIMAVPISLIGVSIRDVFYLKCIC